MKAIISALSVACIALCISTAYYYRENSRLTNTVRGLESDYGWCREELGLHKYGKDIDREVKGRVFGFNIYQEAEELKSMAARTKIQHEREKMKAKETTP